MVFLLMWNDVPALSVGAQNNAVILKTERYPGQPYAVWKIISALWNMWKMVGYIPSKETAGMR